MTLLLNSYREEGVRSFFNVMKIQEILLIDQGNPPFSFVI